MESNLQASSYSSANVAVALAECVLGSDRFVQPQLDCSLLKSPLGGYCSPTVYIIQNQTASDVHITQVADCRA